MLQRLQLSPTVIFSLLVALCIMQHHVTGHPYPHPLPNPRPAVQAANTQPNQFEKSFDKTQFKPPELEETIEEVQKILQKDPTLPRLTRGEIEELYEKVTREEYQKSVAAGDLGRADSMRALMLVLPYNTDNSTAVENLQELYTRQPVTKLIDSYTQPQPIQFITPDPNGAARTETTPIGPLAATTYKPGLPFNAGPNPTTYHPPAPAPVVFKFTTAAEPETIYDFQPIIKPISGSQLNQQTKKPIQRFSSHYNAKNADFLKLAAQQKSKTSTVRPVADVLETLGIVGQIQSRNRLGIDDYYAAESAPKPVISSYIPLTGAEFEGLRGQNIAPKIRPDAYSSFKPLNIGEEIRVKPEVEDYLTRFGILGGRKRKALKKSNAKIEDNVEQTGAGTEIKTTSLPSSLSATKKSTSELEKLLKNLQELEHLNSNRKSTTKTKATTTTAPTTTRATTSTTEAPTSSLITNGDPLLIEPKKPRRRIDPNIDINFGTTGNQQPIHTNEDQLTKLLENLQELEKLRLNPENVLNSATPLVKANKLAVKPIQTTTTKSITTTTPQPKITSNEEVQLERLLKELHSFEEKNAKSTTKKPVSVRTTTTPPFDLLQLRNLLTNDNELERLYEQARRRVVPQTSTTRTTTTTTTAKPVTRDFEFEQLQKYIAELDKARSTSTTTTTTTTTSTTTTRPTTVKTTKNIAATDDTKIEELISRVRELERLNKNQPQSTSTTESVLPYLGFTSRNVKSPVTTSIQATASDYRLPSNDFAQLQQLYRQVQEADRASFGQVEISTAATASKYSARTQEQQFAQRLVDLTNDTGAGDSLQKVEPNDFVQLQKLLSKVQELERVKINRNGPIDSTNPTPNPKSKLVTFAPSLVTAASVHAPNIQSPSAQLIYPESFDRHKYLDFLEQEDELRLDLPAYKPTHQPNSVAKKSGAILLDTTSSEELRELAMSKPINPKQSSIDQDFEQYQELFSSLEDERNSYRISYENMSPPIVEKTIVKESARIVSTKKPHEIVKPKPLNGQQQADLAELQKLLSNAQELEKLGVTLPKTLSDRIESKLTKTTQAVKPTKAIKGPIEPEVNIYLDRYGLKPKPTPPNNEDSSEKVAVFSLTTPKSLTPKPAKATTESSLELPVFSATKIIEAAIKQAANRIGVTTEQPQGFRRRSDEDIDDEIDTEDENNYDDMIGDFSEMNYQLAIPEINRMDELTDEARSFKTDYTEETSTKPMDASNDLSELQRLIGNLQELQRLNISISGDMQHLADTKYLESFKDKLTTADDKVKSRRQSVTPVVTKALDSNITAENSEPTTAASNISNTTNQESTDLKSASTAAIASIDTTPTAPTRVTLGLDLEEPDANTTNSNNNGEKAVSTSTRSISKATTAATTTTTEEPQNGSLADLEASFGPDPNKAEPLPPKKKNGFYFLADWNSFLEVGDGDDQVVVRFSPKIGDPRLFLPIKTP